MSDESTQVIPNNEPVVVETPVSTVSTVSTTELPIAEEFFPEVSSADKSSDIAGMLNAGSRHGDTSDDSYGFMEAPEEPVENVGVSNAELEQAAEEIISAAPEGELSKDDIIAAMRAELDEVKKKLEPTVETTDDATALAAKEKEVVQQFLVEKTNGVFQVVSDEDDLTEMLGTPAGINMLSSRIAHTAIREALRYMMPVTQAEVARGQAMYIFSDQFYRAHPDLRPFVATVSAVTNEMIEANKTIKPEDLFVEVAKEVRKRHKLEDPSKATVVKIAKPAGFSPAGSGAVAGATNTKNTRQELKDDLKAMRRT